MLIRDLTPDECREELARVDFGRLACAHDNQPYVVPVYFVLDHGCIYSFSMLGQKVDWLRTNPLVCLEADRVKGLDDWTTILVFGQYEELLESDNHAERVHAHQLLQKRSMWWAPGSSVVRNHADRGDSSPIYFRVTIDRMTGHRAVPDT